MDVSNKTYHIKDDPYFESGERIVGNFTSANHSFHEISIDTYEGDLEIWYLDRNDPTGSVLAYSNNTWEIEYRYITFGANVTLSGSDFQALVNAYDEYIEPKRLRIIYNNTTKLGKLNGKLRGSITWNNVAYPFDNRAAWATPAITLSGSVVSTPAVTGITKYKVYSNGSYIGYVDANNVWHGEVEPPTPKLDTPANISIASLTISFDTVENAETYEVFANDNSIGEYVSSTMPRISIDLSTLSGWESLADGNYEITVKAKANGYLDSDMSDSVTATKEPAGFSVSITGISDDGSNSCQVFDGNDSSGTSLGPLEVETKTYQITSGYIYLWGTTARQTTPTTTGGVSAITLGESNALFRVTGNGTIGNVGFWCFAEGTLITLADGSRKAVEDITYDDDLLVWNFYEGKFDTAKPAWIIPVKQAPEYNKLTFANGSELKLVGPGGNIGYHRIYNDDSKCFTHTGVPETQTGCKTFTDDGVFTELVSQEVVKEPVNYYNIITEKHYNLFTNGILTSCRLSNQYDIENMKYVGESKMSKQEIAEYLERLER